MLRYLAIDWGEKRIGLALANSETKIASPFKVVNSLKELLVIIEEEEIDKIILGEPKKLRDNQQLNTLWQLFYNTLRRKVDKEIILVDERYSSSAYDSLSGSKKTKASRDAIAASFILSTYLERN